MKSKTHWIAVKVKFDKPTTKADALEMAKDCFEGADQFPYENSDGVGQMWLAKFRNKAPKRKETA